MEPLKPADPTELGGIALRGRLGQGGMGTVYFGVTPDGDQVAVKTVREDLLGKSVVQGRFGREILALGMVAVWLGMDVDALIAMYRARFPVLNRFEETMWFDAQGWKLAGYHRTLGQIQQKTSYEELLAYIESGGTAPVPEGYTAPFYKADREAEYRQAHAVFTEHMNRA